jgi:hypothetical protein
MEVMDSRRDERRFGPKGDATEDFNWSSDESSHTALLHSQHSCEKETRSVMLHHSSRAGQTGSQQRTAIKALCRANLLQLHSL